MGLIVRKGTRKLCNLKEVAEAGARAGFRVELVSFEEMDVHEQIKATTRFDFFVAVHGTPAVHGMPGAAGPGMTVPVCPTLGKVLYTAMPLAP